MPSFDLTDRVAIVTGGAQGLGKGIALGLAQAGAHVVIVARLPEQVTGGKERPHEPVALVVEQIAELGRSSLGITADVRDPDQVKGMVQQTIDAFGRIDILVNVAGGSWGESFKTGPMLDLTTHDFSEAYSLNVKSTFLCSTAVAPTMIQQGKGVITNIASISGRGPSPSYGAYGAAKAAVINISQTMAIEWGPQVRVNVIAVGGVETPHRPRGLDPAQSAARATASVPALGRSGSPEEYAGVVVWLSSDAGSYTTGAVLDIHGGRRR